MNCYVDKIKSICNSVDTKLTQEENDFYEFFRDINSRLQLQMNYQKEYDEECKTLTNRIVESKTKKNLLEKELEQKSSELSDIKDKCDLVSNEGKLHEKKYQSQKRLCQETIKETELSQRDKDMLNVARKRYYLCKDVTNLVWDYTIPCTTMFAGFVRNKSTSYIHAFEFQKSKATRSELEEKVWKEIEMGQHEDWTDIIEMVTQSKTSTESTGKYG